MSVNEVGAGGTPSIAKLPSGLVTALMAPTPP